MTGFVVGITGAGGFLGRALSDRLERAGHTVVPLSRDLGILPMLDAVIHLGGATVAGRWTRGRREGIYKSRVEGTRRLVERMAALDRMPRVFLCASAAGYYGHRPGEPLVESSAPGRGFRSDVCVAWESEARRAEALGVRTVLLRMGTVLDPAGGYLGRLMPLLRRGACFVLGRSLDRISWISLEDAVRAMEFCLASDDVSGAVNLTAPRAATQKSFARILAAWIGRRVLGRLPRTFLRLALGEFARAFIDSQDVRPEKLTRLGFEFRHPELALALPSRSSRR